MKTIVKYMALFAIVAVAAKSFIDAFTPEYEAWKEKYPPEVEPDETDEDPSEVAANVVTAADLFKADGSEKGGL